MFRTLAVQNGGSEVDQVQLGGACRGEMQMKPWVLDFSVVVQRRLPPFQVVHRKLHFQVRRKPPLDALQEVVELDGAMTLLVAADLGAGLHVERGENVERVMPAVVVGVAFGLARLHGEG